VERRTNFFERVIALVQLIPPGKAATYGQIARLLGSPHGARAVGWALHDLSDEQGTRVPWQRVLGRGGRITTSCVTHTPTLQHDLLELEGIAFDAHGDVDLARFGWEGLSGAELRQRGLLPEF